MDLSDQPVGRENMKVPQVYYQKIYEYGQGGNNIEVWDENMQLQL